MHISLSHCALCIGQLNNTFTTKETHNSSHASTLLDLPQVCQFFQPQKNLNFLWSDDIFFLSKQVPNCSLNPIMASSLNPKAKVIKYKMFLLHNEFTHLCHFIF